MRGSNQGQYILRHNRKESIYSIEVFTIHTIDQEKEFQNKGEFLTSQYLRRFDN